MRMSLIGRDLWEMVEGSETLPVDANEDKRRKFRKRENQALSHICLGVSESLQIYIRGAKSGKEAWDNLSSHFEEKSLSRKIMLRRKLYHTVLGNGDMTAHINNIKTIAEHLENLDDIVSEKDLVMVLMISLPESYHNLITALETLDEAKLTWIYVRDRLINEYDRRKSKKNSKDDALLTQNNENFKKGANGTGRKFPNKNHYNSNSKGQQQTKYKCHFCHKKGHFIKDCKEKAAVEAAADKGKQSASFCKIYDDDEDSDDSDDGYEFALFSSEVVLESSCSSSVEIGPSSTDVSAEDVEEDLQFHGDDLDESTDDVFVTEEIDNNLPPAVQFSSVEVVAEAVGDDVSCPYVKSRSHDVTFFSQSGDDSSLSGVDHVYMEHGFEEFLPAESGMTSFSLGDIETSAESLPSGDLETGDEDVLSLKPGDIKEPAVSFLQPGELKQSGPESLQPGDIKQSGPVSLQPGDLETGLTNRSNEACSLYPDEVALQAGDEENTDDKTWWLDSGATSHMTGDDSDFSSFQEDHQPGAVSLADKSEITCLGRGDIRANIFSGDNGKVPILLKNVLYVPGLKRRLLSISSLTESGAIIIFQGSSCTIIINDKKYELGHKHGKLWKLNNVATCCSAVTTPAENGTNTLSLWHQRFGHVNVKDVEKLHTEKLVEGMKMVKLKQLDNNCEGCAVGKATRQPFPKSSSKKSSAVLDLIHSDVCGPLNIPSVGGSIYFVTFIDDYSNFVYVYLLKRKSEVFEKFVEYLAMAENFTGKRLKKFRSDNGGEYVGEEFDKYLKQRGILTEPTVPYTPQQNGKAERMNRTILDNVRSMLHHAKLPKRWWAEAVAACVYLRNRSPTSSFKGETPYERWHGVKPNVEHLRVFGCNVYAHVPSEKRKKLDEKAVKGVFVGYLEGSKGYKIYVPETRKFIRSRDVKFRETSFGQSDLTPDDDNTPDTLDVLNTSSKTSETTDYVPAHVFDSIPDDEESDDAEQSDDEEVGTRPLRNRRNPNRYGEWATIAAAVQPEPKTYKQAVKHEASKQWVEAMEKEFSSLRNHKTWKLVDLPPGRNALGCKWVYKIKWKANGEIEKYKARLVAQGYTQEEGVDYNEVFAPVARYKSIRTVLAIANQFDLEAHQMDVVTAFLNGELEDEIYMKQPEGFVDSKNASKVCKLLRSLYGLKQSARCWNLMMDEYLKSSGYTQGTADPCVYYRVEVTKGANGKTIIVIFAVYVDDTIICSNDKRTLFAEKKRLSERFEMDDRGEVHHILGMEVLRDRQKKILTISQKLYLEEILKRFGMEDCNPVGTPMEPNKHFTKINEDEEQADEKQFQAAIGSLNYAAIATRPDLSTAVGKLSQFMKNPSNDHWCAVKRVLRYIKGTLNLGLKFVASDSFELTGFSDSDWAGCVESRKSTSGFVFQVGQCTVSWSSKKQPIVALSSTEAEYIALCRAAQEAVWLRSLLADVGLTPKTATVVREDNQGAIALGKNPKDHPRTKHIDVKYHYVREVVQNKIIDVVHVPTGDMVADTLTKALPKPSFEKFRMLMGVENCLNC